MEFLDLLGKYQRKILYVHSADYKWNVLLSSIDNINTLISNSEFNFLNISQSVNDLFLNNNYFYDYLENSITWNNTSSNIRIGYNQLNVEALLYNPSNELIIHDNIYIKLNDLYRNYFSNISELSIYAPIFNNFKIETINNSNYLKICYDEEYNNFEYKLASFYHLPIYNLSKSLLSQIFTSIRKNTYPLTLNVITKSDLILSNLNDIDNKIANFILSNIFKETQFNSFYISNITNAVSEKLDDLNLIFNNFIETKIFNDYFISCINDIYTNYIEEYAYKLSTDYREREIVNFATPINTYQLMANQILIDTKKISARTIDLKSIITITYKYRNDTLQFINSNLAVFSDWTDLLINNQYDNIDYYDSLLKSPFESDGEDINVLHSKHINTIIKSITINKSLFLNEIKTNFINDFKNSKTIELTIYNHLAEIVASFINSAEFKSYIISDFIEPVALVCKTRFPKMYKELYENIDNIINYIKYLLTLKLYESSNLPEKYRNLILNTQIEIENFDEFLLDNIISRFYTVDSVSLKEYQNDIIKFITSMSTLLFFDRYIDNYRLIKKYVDRPTIIESPYAIK